MGQRTQNEILIQLVELNRFEINELIKRVGKLEDEINDLMFDNQNRN